MTTRIDTTAILTDKIAKEAELKAHIDDLNAIVSSGRLPSTDTLKEIERKVAEVCQWYAACEIINFTLEKLKVKELSDEQVKIALCKARFFTTWTGKQNKNGHFELKDKEARFDVTEILKKLGISTAYTSDIQILGLYLTLSIADLVDDKKRNLVTGCYKLDKLARQKFVTGIDPLSKRQTVKAVQTALDSFIPESGYKALNHDWNFLQLAASVRNKKSTNTVKIINKRQLEELFYDYINNLAMHEGVSVYSVEYKHYKDGEVRNVIPTTENNVDKTLAALYDVENVEEKPTSKKTTRKTTKKTA